MSLSLTTHEFEKVPNSSGQWKISRVHPYVRLGKQGVAFYIQDGKIWQETGELCDDPPQWVFDEARRMGAAAKAEVGWKDPEPQAPQAASQGNTLSLKGKG